MESMTAGGYADALVSGRTYQARTFRLGGDSDAIPPFGPVRLHVEHYRGRAVSVTTMDEDWAEIDPRQEAFMRDGVLTLVTEDYRLDIDTASIGIAA